jgi:hypothetical protein
MKQNVACICRGPLFLAILTFLYRVFWKSRDFVGRDSERRWRFQPILGSVRFRMRTHMFAGCRNRKGIRYVAIWKETLLWDTASASKCYCCVWLYCALVKTALVAETRSALNTARPSVCRIIAYFTCCLFGQTISVCLLYVPARCTQYRAASVNRCYFKVKIVPSVTVHVKSVSLTGSF